MTDAQDDTRELELPPREDVERSLRLGAEDRSDLQSLHRMNTRDLPFARMVGILIALAVAPIHNAVILGDPRWGSLAVLAGVSLVYGLGSWAVLRAWFHRSSIHLGFVFVYTDLLVFAAFIQATGGPESLYWPSFFIRIADQLWLSRRRATVMVLLSVVVYGGLVVAWSATGTPMYVGTEAMKVAVLGCVGIVLLMIARSPWDVFERTTAARDLILRLEEQSVELDEERRRAQAANRSKSEFLARMSHELRTPLNSVMGFTNVLLKRKGEVLGDREVDYLVRIRQNGIHLLALINDILDLARIEQGKMDIHIAPVDLAALVRDTAHQLEGQVERNRVRLEVEIPPDLAPVPADEVRLRQVLINLVGNALKFTEEGSVTVRIVVDDDGTTARRIEVEDTGVGVPSERLDRIFEAFEQAEGGTSRKHGGTGLGLAIARSLCVLMGFRLTLDSVLGEGSTFTIWLPEDASSGSVDPPSGVTVEPGQGA